DLAVLRKWENTHADSNGCHNDNSRRDKNTAEEAAEISSKLDDSITFGNISQQNDRKKKARNRQENVNAARVSPITKKMEEYHTQDGKPAYPMELWSVAACWEIFRDRFRC